jgi:CTP:molybdopterin cytidylyltransferase MocA
MATAAIVLADQPMPDGACAALFPVAQDIVLAEHVIAALRDAGIRDIEVVLGCDAEQVIPHLYGDNIEPIVNDGWAAGVASSLRVGASAVPRGSTPVVILPVTSPRSPGVITAVLDRHRSGVAHLTQATVRGTASWPAVASGAFLEALRNLPDDAVLPGEANLAEVLRRLTDAVSDVPVGPAEATDIVTAAGAEQRRG